MVGMILSAEDTDSIDLLSADSFAEWDPLGQYRDSRAVVGAGIWVHMWVPPAGGFYLDVSCGGHFPPPPLSLSFCPVIQDTVSEVRCSIYFQSHSLMCPSALYEAWCQAQRGC